MHRDQFGRLAKHQMCRLRFLHTILLVGFWLPIGNRTLPGRM
jgi:hypothetical protein